jgi:hypothetical protein
VVDAGWRVWKDSIHTLLLRQASGRQARDEDGRTRSCARPTAPSVSAVAPAAPTRPLRQPKLPCQPGGDDSSESREKGGVSV